MKTSIYIPDKADVLQFRSNFHSEKDLCNKPITVYSALIITSLDVNIQVIFLYSIIIFIVLCL